MVPRVRCDSQAIHPACPRRALAATALFLEPDDLYRAIEVPSRDSLSDLRENRLRDAKLDFYVRWESCGVSPELLFRVVGREVCLQLRLAVHSLACLVVALNIRN